MDEKRTHWAYEIADTVAKKGGEIVISTGITPSGEYHVGHLREVLTAYAVSRALTEINVKHKIHYMADTMDPLRKVSPFLDEKKYKEEVGRPLFKIPCPCDKHESYAEHYLDPFLSSLKKLGIELEIFRAHDFYLKGLYDGVILEALKARDHIASILKELTGRDVEESWSPYNPICKNCGRIISTKVLGFSEENKSLEYECTCGQKGESEFSAGGKLTWRVDWPARWKVLGVSVEPFGKDHSSRGGSYDTGKRIAREVFGVSEPYPIVYEWIGLKGMGDMSSSKGNVVSISEILDIIPPEVVKYYILKAKPTKHITFDPVTSLVNLIDEYDEGGNVTNPEAYKLSQFDGLRRVGVPFKHLVILLQITEGNIEEIKKRLLKSGYQLPPDDVLNERLSYASNWLKRFAPKESKFEIKKELPEQVKELSELQKRALSKIEASLSETNTGEEIQQLIYDVSKELEIPTKDLFTALYIIFLGKSEGPRVGLLLQSLKFEFVKGRLMEIIS